MNIFYLFIFFFKNRKTCNIECRKGYLFPDGVSIVSLDCVYGDFRPTRIDLIEIPPCIKLMHTNDDEDYGDDYDSGSYKDSGENKSGNVDNDNDKSNDSNDSDDSLEKDDYYDDDEFTVLNPNIMNKQADINEGSDVSIWF